MIKSILLVPKHPKFKRLTEYKNVCSALTEAPKLNQWDITDKKCVNQF